MKVDFDGTFNVFVISLKKNTFNLSIILGLPKIEDLTT